jgi:hypothetical protein
MHKLVLKGRSVKKVVIITIVSFPIIFPIIVLLHALLLHAFSFFEIYRRLTCRSSLRYQKQKSQVPLSAGM